MNSEEIREEDEVWQERKKGRDGRARDLESLFVRSLAPSSQTASKPSVDLVPLEPRAISSLGWQRDGRVLVAEGVEKREGRTRPDGRIKKTRKEERRGRGERERRPFLRLLGTEVRGRRRRLLQISSKLYRERLSSIEEKRARRRDEEGETTSSLPDSLLPISSSSFALVLLSRFHHAAILLYPLFDSPRVPLSDLAPVSRASKTKGLTQTRNGSNSGSESSSLAHAHQRRSFADDGSEHFVEGRGEGERGGG